MNLADKRRALRTMCIGLPGKLKAAGIDATVDDNTDCDLPHIVVMSRPSAKKPDGLLLQVDHPLAMDAEDVVHFFKNDP